MYEGDFNQKVKTLLTSGTLKTKEATFCLLDQRTFECDWATVAALARHKSPAKNKIELLYFLPNSWLDRALSGLRDDEILKRWWGRGDYSQLRRLGRRARLDLFTDRFKNELKYSSVKPWPIREHSDSGNIMYYMIHATDHPAAPSLMDRAYRYATRPTDSPEQIAMMLGL